MTKAPLRVALDQGAGDSGDPASSLTRLTERARTAASAGAHLLIGPEMSLTGYNIGDAVSRSAEPADGPLFEAVAGIAAATGIAIVYGFPERAGEHVYNTVQLVDGHGRSLARYRKTHLFEDPDRRVFTPGEKLVVQADLQGHRVGLLICYDVEFPEAVRAHALAGTELLVVPTALMEPDTRVATLLVPTRAMENQLHLAYVNRCDREGDLDYVGLSTLVAPDGTELLRAGAGEALLVGDTAPTVAHDFLERLSYLEDRRPELYGPLLE